MANPAVAAAAAVPAEAAGQAVTADVRAAAVAAVAEAEVSAAACTLPGSTCEWHSGNDEMECDCSCGSDGYWQCTPETSNSACPG